jgi:hypothetical protein
MTASEPIGRSHVANRLPRRVGPTSSTWLDIRNAPQPPSGVMAWGVGRR